MIVMSEYWVWWWWVSSKGDSDEWVLSVIVMSQ